MHTTENIIKDKTKKDHGFDFLYEVVTQNGVFYSLQTKEHIVKITFEAIQMI